MAGRNPKFYGGSFLTEVLEYTPAREWLINAFTSSKTREEVEKMLSEMRLAEHTLENAFYSPAGKKIIKTLLGFADNQLNSLIDNFWQEFDATVDTQAHTNSQGYGQELDTLCRQIPLAYSKYDDAKLLTQNSSVREVFDNKPCCCQILDIVGNADCITPWLRWAAPIRADVFFASARGRQIIKQRTKLDDSQITQMQNIVLRHMGLAPVM